MSAWRRLTFAISRAAQDDLIVRLHELGSLGVETVGERLEAWFGDPVDETALLADLERTLARDAGARIVRSEPVAEGFWHERWMASLQPFEVGERFLVVPGPATQADARGRRVIRLTPGRAFGTGEHATTRMCLSMIERGVRRGESLLDFGTGSGILAIAAHMLGADPVTGIDIDETSVRVAAINRAINEAEGIRLIAGSLAAIQPRPFDLVAANIDGATLTRLMAPLAALVRREAILSGILEEEEREVTAAARREGLELAHRMLDGGWVALDLARRGSV